MYSIVVQNKTNYCTKNRVINNKIQGKIQLVEMEY